MTHNVISEEEMKLLLSPDSDAEQKEHSPQAPKLTMKYLYERIGELQRQNLLLARRIDVLEQLVNEYCLTRGEAAAARQNTEAPEQDTAGPEHNTTGPEQDTAGPMLNAPGPEHNAAGPEHNAAGPQQNAAGPEHNAAGPMQNAALLMQSAAVSEPQIRASQGAQPSTESDSFIMIPRSVRHPAPKRASLWSLLIRSRSS